jgi:hypothetical protein
MQGLCLQGKAQQSAINSMQAYGINQDFPISMSKEKVGMQWRKHIVAIQKCIAAVDHVESQFKCSLLTFFEKL